MLWRLGFNGGIEYTQSLHQSNAVRASSRHPIQWSLTIEETLEVGIYGYC